MDDVRGPVDSLVDAAKYFGSGFWSVAVVVLAAIAIWKSPEIIKAISTFVTEYRKTTSKIEADQSRLTLEVERKIRKFRLDKKK